MRVSTAFGRRDLPGFSDCPENRQHSLKSRLGSPGSHGSQVKKIWSRCFYCPADTFLEFEGDLLQRNVRDASFSDCIGAAQRDEPRRRPRLITWVLASRQLSLRIYNERSIDQADVLGIPRKTWMLVRRDAEAR